MRTAVATETILLVEDEPMVRKLAAAVLGAKGYTVLQAADARDAMVVAHAHLDVIDLLLTDVSMPGRSGVELARDLAALRPDLPVVFMSGFSEFAEELEGRGAEMIGKPFSPLALTDRVREVLDNTDITVTTTAFI